MNFAHTGPELFFPLKIQTLFILQRLRNKLYKLYQSCSLAPMIAFVSFRVRGNSLESFIVLVCTCEVD